MARRRAKQAPKGKEEDVRFMAGLATFGVVSVLMFATFLIAPPPAVGPEEGELAPDFVAKGYDGGAWSDYRLYDNIDREWTPGNASSWILLQFLDTDCPYCWSEGEAMSSIRSTWGNDLQIVSVAVELSIAGHNSDRDEIEAFRDKTNFGTDDNDGNGCNSGRSNCVDRPGEVHDWVYIDDYNSDIMASYKVKSTPVIIVLQPDGTVAWNQYSNSGEDIEDALQRLMGGN